MKTVALGEVAKFVRGVTFKPGDVLDQPTGQSVGVMRTKNVQDALDITDVLQIPCDLVPRDDQYLHEGDLLISSANSWNLVGKCCWVPQLEAPAAIGGFVTGLRVTSNTLNPRYLYRWFSSPRTQASVRNTANQTTNIANLSLSRCEALPLPLPPLDEQRRIAAILDHADSLRAKCGQAVALLHDLAASTFMAMFGDPLRNERGWGTANLGSLGEWHSGATPPRAKPQYFSGDIPWYSSGELGPLFSATPNERVSTLALQNTSLKRVPGGSLMLGMYDTAAFKSSIASTDCSCNQAVAFSQIDNEMADTVFVYFAIQMASSRLRKLQRGIRQKNLNLSIVRSIEIPVPPIGLQEEFRGKTLAALHMRDQIEVASHAFDGLFASLQSRAFRGEL